MIEEVVSVDLAVHERLTVRKNRLAPKQLTGNEQRISIVTGTHGDELDGQYVCYEIVKQLNAHPEKLKGIVDIYPDVNPLGLDTGSRGIPMFDLDMNRVFPGDNNGAITEYLAAGIIDDIIGSDMQSCSMRILSGFIHLLQCWKQHLPTASIIWVCRL